MIEAFTNIKVPCQAPMGNAGIVIGDNIKSKGGNCVAWHLSSIV
jgi:hypothetical protein